MGHLLIQLQLTYLTFSLINSYRMKALNQTQNGSQTVEQQQQQNSLMKKFIELQNINKQKQLLICKYQQTIKSLEQQNNTLDQELEKHQKQWNQLQNKLEEEKSQGEEEHQMNDWIQSVQKYNGLPQAAIDSLCSIEFQGGEQQICLSCYQELSAGTMCTYLPCCHLFHKDCIGSHLKINKMCPACQQVVVI